MAEPNPIIGLTWEPKLPGLPASAAKQKPHHSQSPETSSALYRPRSELIDGLYVPPSDPKKLKKLLRKEVKDTAGKNWFDMPAPSITPELKKDLQLLKMRDAFDPKRHYKKGDSKSKTLPKYFQVGVVIEPASEFYSSRLSKKERKATLAEELISDTNLVEYRKRKVREIEEQKRPGGVDKWKIRGQQSRKRAKHRQH
nr:rRNA-processing protein fcf2-like [Ipomoea batatas]